MRRNKQLERRITRERIEILLKQAMENIQDNPDRSRRYVSLAKKLALKYRIKIPKQYKKRICKKCNSFLGADNSLTRLKNKCVTVICLTCGNIIRIPYYGRKDRK
jgi:ribonuclease P protein subunit RPR2